MVSRQDSVDPINMHEEQGDISDMSLVTQENTGVGSSQQPDLEDVNHQAISLLLPQDSFDSSQSTIKEQTSKDSFTDRDGSDEEISSVPRVSNMIDDKILESTVERTDDNADEQTLLGRQGKVSENGSRNNKHENQIGEVSLMESEMDNIINKYRRKMEQVLNTSHSEFDTQVDKTFDDMENDVDKIELNIIIRLVDEQLKEVVQTCSNHFIEIERNLISEIERLKEREPKIKRDIDIAVEKKVNKTLEHDKITQVMSGIESLITTKMNECIKDVGKKIDQVEEKLQALEIASPEDNNTTEIITGMECKVNNWHNDFDKRITSIEEAGSSIERKSSGIEAMLMSLQESIAHLKESLRSLVEHQVERLMNVEVEKSNKRVNEVFDKIEEVEKETYLLREDVEKIKFEKKQDNIGDKFKVHDKKIASVREELKKLENKCKELESQYMKVLETRASTEENVYSVEQRLRDEINESSNEIVKRLEEDRAAKWKQIVDAVKDEA
ncbi:17836_t:CDS:1, partial [Acaulospora morrowiae]